MTITSLFFLFAYLPLVLLIYYLVGVSAREYVLLAASLLFYAAASPKYAILFFICIAVTVILGRVMAKVSHTSVRKVLLVVGIVLNAGLLVFFKYSGFAMSAAYRILGKTGKAESLVMPLGISFFTFKAVSYLADIEQGKAALEKHPVHDLLYLSFFAQIQSGPITRIGDFHCQGDRSREGRKRTAALFSDGAVRFLIGFSKKMLIANMLANVVNEVFAASFDRFSTSYAWLGSLCYSLQIFFDFAGYSDMAIGISEMFGYPCMENFNYPYMTESVSRFWRRWHISLSQWFRDYIYIPLGGSRTKKKYQVYRNLLAVWLLTGIWHGASMNYILWGLGYFVLIAFEKATGLPGKLRTKPGRFLYRILTLLFINFEWVLFRAGSIRKAASYLRRMILCPKNPLADARTLFLLKNYWAFILAGCILSFPVIPWLEKKLSGRKAASAAFETAAGIVIIGAFILSVSFAVTGQNNPFVYANF